MIIEPTEYKTAETKSKQRIHGGKFGNALGQTPWMHFDESFLSWDAVAEKLYVNEAGSCRCELTDPLKTLTLRNPLDDSIIGESTYQDVFVLLYSLGRQTQIERDAEMIVARNTVAE